MRKIRNRIFKMKDGAEKTFLWDTLNTVERAMKANDIQKLEFVNKRLINLYDGLSREAQEISLEISRKIMEVRNV